MCISWLSLKDTDAQFSLCGIGNTDSKTTFLLTMDTRDVYDKTYTLKLADDI